MLVDGLVRVRCGSGRGAFPAVYFSFPLLLASAAAGRTDLSFAEVSLSRGVNYILGTPAVQFGAGHGLIDLDNDGHLDIVILGASNGLVGVYENNGSGSFINRSFATGIAPMTGAAGLSAADYDGDGDIDLFLSGWHVANRLLRNNGNFNFTDVTVASGLVLSCPSQATAWSDFNGDGWLDLYLAVRTGDLGDFTRNKMYQNMGNGTFSEVAAAVGVEAGTDPTLLPAFFDFDRDGDDDLYLGTDKGSNGVFANRLFRNDAGTFTEITATANAQAYVDCMGIAIGDLNFDGFFDLYVTNIALGNKLMMHDGEGAFVDLTAAAGMQNLRYAWATVFADFNNDSWLDTYVCNLQNANRLYEGAPAFPYPDVALAAGVATPNTSYSVSVGDIDNDGDLDMLVDESGTRIKLYLNNTPAINNHVRFSVAGQGANKRAVGATLELDIAGVPHLRQIYSGSNFKAMNEYTVHYGMGSETQADSLLVRWPGTGHARTLTNIPAGEQWTIYPPERMGDVNGDGKVTRQDVFAALNQGSLFVGTPVVPGQEMMDMNGDFTLTAQDLALLVAAGPRITTPTP